MIAATQTTNSAGAQGWPGRSRYAWGATLTAETAYGVLRRPAPPARPRAFAATLQHLLTDGAVLRHPDRARAAALAFTAGDGFLPGQIIDRAI